MRLIVQVLPLLPENSHRGFVPSHLAAFKSRKFALPVDPSHTFEQVWKTAEERYKRNYLTPPQAASFIIKKLQDAYDCDLDLGDTVGSIFEGETDQEKRMIKIVPGFVDRGVSVPVTSNLRPAYAQKRLQEINEQHANKRQRLEGHHYRITTQEVAPDKPLPSTELDESGDNGPGNGEQGLGDGEEQGARLGSQDSVIYVKNSQLEGMNEKGNLDLLPKIESPELRFRAIPESDEDERSSGEDKNGRLSSQSGPAVNGVPSPTQRTSASLSNGHDQENRMLHSRSRNPQSSATARSNGHLAPAGNSAEGSKNSPTPFLYEQAQAFSVNLTSPSDGDTSAVDHGKRKKAVARKSVYDILDTPEPEMPVPKTGRRITTFGRFPQAPKLHETALDRPQSSSSNSHDNKRGTVHSAQPEPGKPLFKLPEQGPVMATSETDQTRLVRGDSPMYASKVIGMVHEARQSQASQANLQTASQPSHQSPPSSRPSSLKKPTKTFYELPKPRKGQSIGKGRHSNGTGRSYKSATPNNLSNPAHPPVEKELQTAEETVPSATSSIELGDPSFRLAVNHAEDLIRADAPNSDETSRLNVTKDGTSHRSTQPSSSRKSALMPSERPAVYGTPQSSTASRHTAQKKQSVMVGPQVIVPEKGAELATTADKGSSSLISVTPKPTQPRGAPMGSEIPLPENVRSLWTQARSHPPQTANGRKHSRESPETNAESPPMTAIEMLKRNIKGRTCESPVGTPKNWPGSSPLGIHPVLPFQAHSGPTDGNSVQGGGNPVPSKNNKETVTAALSPDEKPVKRGRGRPRKNVTLTPARITNTKTVPSAKALRSAEKTLTQSAQATPSEAPRSSAARPFNGDVTPTITPAMRQTLLRGFGSRDKDIEAEPSASLEASGQEPIVVSSGSPSSSADSDSEQAQLAPLKTTKEKGGADTRRMSASNRPELPRDISPPDSAQRPLKEPTENRLQAARPKASGDIADSEAEAQLWSEIEASQKRANPEAQGADAEAPVSPTVRKFIAAATANAKDEKHTVSEDMTQSSPSSKISKVEPRAIVSEFESGSESGPEPEPEAEAKPNANANAKLRAEQEAESESDSRSEDGGETTHRPARYLTHSPTPRSGSEAPSDSSADSVIEAAEEQEPNGVNGNGASDDEDDYKSTSSSSSSSDEEDGDTRQAATMPNGDGDGDVEMPDVDALPASSPPQLMNGARERMFKPNHAQQSAFPASQPLPGHSDAPEFRSASRLIKSPQATVPSRPRYSKYPSLSQQVQEMSKSVPPPSPPKKFDPLAQSMKSLKGKMATKGARKTKVFDLSETDDSEDDSESSSGSGSGDEDEVFERRPGCLVG